MDKWLSPDPVELDCCKIIIWALRPPQSFVFYFSLQKSIPPTPLASQVANLFALSFPYH